MSENFENETEQLNENSAAKWVNANIDVQSSELINQSQDAYGQQISSIQQNTLSINARTSALNSMNEATQKQIELEQTLKEINSGAESFQDLLNDIGLDSSLGTLAKQGKHRFNGSYPENQSFQTLLGKMGDNTPIENLQRLGESYYQSIHSTLEVAYKNFATFLTSTLDEVQSGFQLLLDAPEWQKDARERVNRIYGKLTGTIQDAEVIEKPAANKPTEAEMRSAFTETLKTFLSKSLDTKTDRINNSGLSKYHTDHINEIMRDAYQQLEGVLSANQNLYEQYKNGENIYKELGTAVKTVNSQIQDSVDYLKNERAKHEQQEKAKDRDAYKSTTWNKAVNKGRAAYEAFSQKDKKEDNKVISFRQLLREFENAKKFLEEISNKTWRTREELQYISNFKEREKTIGSLGTRDEKGDFVQGAGLLGSTEALYNELIKLKTQLDSNNLTLEEREKLEAKFGEKSEKYSKSLEDLSKKLQDVNKQTRKDVDTDPKQYNDYKYALRRNSRQQELFERQNPRTFGTTGNLRESFLKTVFNKSEGLRQRQGLTGFAANLGYNASGTGLSVILGGLAKGAVGATKALWDFAKGSIDAYKQIESLKVNLEVVFGNKTEAGAMFDELASYAVKSPFSVASTEQFAIQLKQSGVSATNLLDTLKMIGDTAGGNEEKMKRIANNYAQIQANGKANTRDLREFATAGIPIYAELARLMDTSVQGVRELAEEGKITNSVIEKVFKNMTNKGGVFYQSVEKGAKTLQARTVNYEDIKMMSQAEVGEVLKWFPETFLNIKTMLLEIPYNIASAINDKKKEKLYVDYMKVEKSVTAKQEQEGNSKEPKDASTFMSTGTGDSELDALILDYQKSVGFDIEEARNFYGKQYQEKLDEFKGSYDFVELRERMSDLYQKYYELYNSTGNSQYLTLSQKVLDMAYSSYGLRQQDLMDTTKEYIDELRGEVDSDKRKLEENAFLRNQWLMVNGVKQTTSAFDVVDANSKLEDAINASIQQQEEYYKKSEQYQIEQKNEELKKLDELIEKSTKELKVGLATDKNGTAATNLDWLSSNAISANERYDLLKKNTLTGNTYTVTPEAVTQATVDEINDKAEKMFKYIGELAKEQVEDAKKWTREFDKDAKKRGGNIDGANRTAIRNNDGTISTVAQMVIEDTLSDRAGLFATILEDGTRLQTEEVKAAAEEFFRTGRAPYNFIIDIRNGENAKQELEREAEEYHQRQDVIYNNGEDEAFGAALGFLDQLAEATKSDIGLVFGEISEWLKTLEESGHYATDMIKTLMSTVMTNVSFKALNNNHLLAGKTATKGKDTYPLWQRILNSTLGVDLEHFKSGQITRGDQAVELFAKQAQKNSVKNITRAMLNNMSVADVFSVNGGTRIAYTGKKTSTGNNSRDNTSSIDWEGTAKNFQSFAMSLTSATEVTQAYASSLQEETDSLREFLASSFTTMEDGANIYDPEYQKHLGEFANSIKATDANAYDVLFTNENGFIKMRENATTAAKALLDQKTQLTQTVSALSEFKSKIDELSKSTDALSVELSVMAGGAQKGAFKGWDTATVKDFTNKLTDTLNKDEYRELAQNEKFQVRNILKLFTDDESFRELAESARITEFVQKNDEAKNTEVSEAQRKYDEAKNNFKKQQEIVESEYRKWFENVVSVKQRAGFGGTFEEMHKNREQNNAAWSSFEEYAKDKDNIQKIFEAYNKAARDVNQASKDLSEEDSKTSNFSTDAEKLAEAEQNLMLAIYQNYVATYENTKALKQLEFVNKFNEKNVRKQVMNGEYQHSFLLGSDLTINAARTDANSIMEQNLMNQLGLGEMNYQDTIRDLINNPDAAGFFTGLGSEYSQEILQKQLRLYDELIEKLNSGEISQEEFDNQNTWSGKSGTSYNLFKKIDSAVFKDSVKNMLDDAEKSIGESLSSGLFSGVADTFKTMGKYIDDMSAGSEEIAKCWKQIGANIFGTIGSTMIQTGLTIAGQAALKGEWGMVFAGLTMAGVGGIASLISGMFEDDEQDDKESRLKNLKDMLADLLEQAKTDAEYYEKNLRHENAIDRGYDLSYQSVNDAIIAPGGKVITTAPDDYLIATKTPGSLAGGRGNVNITIVNEAGDRVKVGKTEQREGPNGELDIRATIVAVVNEAVANGEVDGAFAAREANNSGRRYTM